MQNDQEKTYTCEKCGKTKHEHEGSFKKDEKTFCCESCCGKQDEKPLVCEFC